MGFVRMKIYSRSLFRDPLGASENLGSGFTGFESVFQLCFFQFPRVKALGFKGQRLQGVKSTVHAGDSLYLTLMEFPTFWASILDPKP